MRSFTAERYGVSPFQVFPHPTMIHCSTCKREVLRSELSKTVPGGHKLTYQLWHHRCGTRVDGIGEHGPRESYADIPYSDQVPESKDPALDFLNNAMRKIM